MGGYWDPIRGTYPIWGHDPRYPDRVYPLVWSLYGSIMGVFIRYMLPNGIHPLTLYVPIMGT